MSGGGLPWVVLRVRQLARAKDNVERQGAEFYAPIAMIRSERTHRLRPRPLFVEYAFARHPEGRWHFLRGTLGVASILMGTNEQPAWLPAAEIDKLRAREGPDGLVRLRSAEFKVGEHVRVERGAVSLDAVVEGMSGQDCVHVLLAALGRWTRAEVSVRDISR